MWKGMLKMGTSYFSSNSLIQVDKYKMSIQIMTITTSSCERNWVTLGLLCHLEWHALNDHSFRLEEVFGPMTKLILQINLKLMHGLLKKLWLSACSKLSLLTSVRSQVSVSITCVEQAHVLEVGVKVSVHHVFHWLP